MFELGRLSHLSRELTATVMQSWHAVLVVLRRRSIKLRALRLVLPITHNSFIWIIIISDVIILAWFVDVVVKLII